MKNPQVPIAKEGYPFIYFASFATLILAIIACSWVAYLGLICTTFIICFFRDPERFIPAQENTVVSPADGRVLSVEKLFDETYLNEEVHKICIFMNVFNVHVNRSPFSGKVEQINHVPGKFYTADSDKGGLLNEKCATVISLSSGQKIAFVQIAGLIARRIVNWLEVADTIHKGDRMGLIRFGSRVDVYLPSSAAVAVKKGQKIRAGESIIAYLYD